MGYIHPSPSSEIGAAISRVVELRILLLRARPGYPLQFALRRELDNRRFRLAKMLLERSGKGPAIPA